MRYEGNSRILLCFPWNYIIWLPKQKSSKVFLKSTYYYTGLMKGYGRNPELNINKVVIIKKANIGKICIQFFVLKHQFLFYNALWYFFFVVFISTFIFATLKFSRSVKCLIKYSQIIKTLWFNLNFNEIKTLVCKL